MLSLFTLSWHWISTHWHNALSGAGLDTLTCMVSNKLFED